MASVGEDRELKAILLRPDSVGMTCVAGYNQDLRAETSEASQVIPNSAEFSLADACEGERKCARE